MQNAKDSEYVDDLNFSIVKQFIEEASEKSKFSKYYKFISHLLIFYSFREVLDILNRLHLSYATLNRDTIH